MRDRLRDWIGLRHDVRRDVGDGVAVRDWNKVAHSLRNCVEGKPCADCGREPMWNCDWQLMEVAAALIEKMAKELGLESEKDTNAV